MFRPEPNNSIRAEWARVALAAFTESTSFGPQDDQEMCGDLLCNLFHLADEEGWDLNQMFETAKLVYLEEYMEEAKEEDD